MKLQNGFGSVYKLTGKRRKPYIVRKTKGWNDDGKQLYITIGYTKTKMEGIKLLMEYNNEPYDIDLSKITFQELYERWKPSIEKLSKKRQSAYKNALKHCEKIKDKSFISIKKFDVQTCIDECGAGYDTQINIKILYNKLYEYAKDIEVPVKHNVAENVTLAEKVKSSLHRDFSEDEIQTLWKYQKASIWRDMLLVYIYTGMRPTELFIIEKTKCFFEKEYPYCVGGIKTSAGIDRIIPIHNRILPIVKKYYNNSSKYLFEINNKKISYTTFLEEIKNFLQSLNMNHLPHDCRHTFATLADKYNLNRICKKLILGHEITDITDGTYTHKSIHDLSIEVNRIQ